MCCPPLRWAKTCWDCPSRWNAAVVASPVPYMEAVWAVRQSHFFFGNAAAKGKGLIQKLPAFSGGFPGWAPAEVLVSPHQPGVEPWCWRPQPSSVHISGGKEAAGAWAHLSACFLLFSAFSLRNKVCSCVILTRLKNLLLQAALSLSVVLGLLSRGRRDHNTEGAQKQPEPHFSDRQQGEESQSLPPSLIVFILCFFSLLVLRLRAKLWFFTSWSKLAASMCRLMDYFRWQSGWLC